MLEILVTVAITFIMFLLMYRTFFTGYSVAGGVTAHIDEADVRFALLRQFHRRMTTVVRDAEAFDGAQDTLTFLCETPGEVCPVKITYAVRNGPDDRLELWESSESQLFSRTFAYPVLDGAEDISFSYFDGADWLDSWDGDEFPCGVALRIVAHGREYFMPVKTGDKKDEENEQPAQ